MIPSTPPHRRGPALPLWFEALIVRMSRWPWWIIIILVGIIAIFYSVSISELYRRAMAFVTQSPQLTTDQIANVLYRVKKTDGTTEDIAGVLTSENNDSVTIITQAEALSTVLHSDAGKITCDKPDANGNCPINQSVTVIRATMDGILLFETLGQYTIRTSYLVDEKPYRIALVKDKEQRIPTGCKANPEGGCNIKVTFNPERSESQVAGVLLENSPDKLVIQTAPKITRTVARADIVSEISRDPAQCALNNPGACNEGIFLTIWVTFAAFVSAMIIGLVFGLMRVSTSPVLFNLSTVYVEVIRGVPLLVILLFVNFAFRPWFRDNFPDSAPNIRVIMAVIGIAVAAFYLVTRWPRRQTDPVELIQPVALALLLTVVLIVLVSFFGTRPNNDLTAVQTGILGLAIGYGAFLAELFRAGIQSIGRGQMEAARSLGMSYVEAMRYVVLPQAFRVILPPLGNDFIAMLKDTSLVAILALPELTQKARLFSADTFRPFESYVTIGVLYLCMTLFLSFMVRVLERRVSIPR